MTGDTADVSKAVRLTPIEHFAVLSRWCGFGSGRPSSVLTGTSSLQNHLGGQQESADETGTGTRACGRAR
jgi:hypothetical protein